MSEWTLNSPPLSPQAQIEAIRIAAQDPSPVDGFGNRAANPASGFHSRPQQPIRLMYWTGPLSPSRVCHTRNHSIWGYCHLESPHTRRSPIPPPPLRTPLRPCGIDGDRLDVCGGTSGMMQRNLPSKPSYATAEPRLSKYWLPAHIFPQFPSRWLAATEDIAGLAKLCPVSAISKTLTGVHRQGASGIHSDNYRNPG